MHDTVGLEARGLPTAFVLTEPFVHEAEMQGEALGMQGLSLAVIDHPLSTLTDDGIALRAAQAAPDVRSIWLGRRA
jgi:hypothetical protein